jgi:hypothetical protein
MTTGCADTAATAGYSANSGNTWVVTLTQSGGIAGVMRTLTVSSSGVMDVTERVDSMVTSRILSAVEFEHLQSLVMGTGSQKNRATENSVNRQCRDCMQFQLTVHNAGKELRYTADSSGLASYPHYLLITTLLRLAN